MLCAYMLDVALINPLSGSHDVRDLCEYVYADRAMHTSDQFECLIASQAHNSAAPAVAQVSISSAL